MAIRLQIYAVQGQTDEALVASDLVLAHEAYLPDEVVALAQSQVALAAFAEGEEETAVAAARTASALDHGLSDESVDSIFYRGNGRILCSKTS